MMQFIIPYLASVARTRPRKQIFFRDILTVFFQQLQAIIVSRNDCPIGTNKRDPISSPCPALCNACKSCSLLARNFDASMYLASCLFWRCFLAFRRAFASFLRRYLSKSFGSLPLISLKKGKRAERKGFMRFSLYNFNSALSFATHAKTLSVAANSSSVKPYCSYGICFSSSSPSSQMSNAPKGNKCRLSALLRHNPNQTFSLQPQVLY